MSRDVRCKDWNWSVRSSVADTVGASWEGAHLAVLMDIRDRLDVLNCPNAIDIPNILRRIEARLLAVEKNTLKRRPRGRRPRR